MGILIAVFVLVAAMAAFILVAIISLIMSVSMASVNAATNVAIAGAAHNQVDYPANKRNQIKPVLNTILAVVGIGILSVIFATTASIRVLPDEIDWIRGNCAPNCGEVVIWQALLAKETLIERVSVMFVGMVLALATALVPSRIVAVITILLSTAAISFWIQTYSGISYVFIGDDITEIIGLDRLSWLNQPMASFIEICTKISVFSLFAITFGIAALRFTQKPQKIIKLSAQFQVFFYAAIFIAFAWNRLELSASII